MEVTCNQCSTRYLVPDDKVRGRKVRLPCRRCGNTIVINARPGAGPKPALPQRAPSSKRTEIGGLHAPPRPTKPDAWSVSVGGTTREMSVQEIADGFKAGAIPANAYVWRRSMADWVLLSDASELTDAMEKKGAHVRAPESVRGLADALGDDAEATRLVSSPLASALSAADADLDAEVTRLAQPLDSALGEGVAPEVTVLAKPFASSPGGRDAASEVSRLAKPKPLAPALADAVGDEVTRIAQPLASAMDDSASDEVTRLAQPLDSGLSDAAGDDDEATRFLSAAGRSSAPPAPPKGALSRAERSEAVAPPKLSSTAPPPLESSVVVADSPSKQKTVIRKFAPFMPPEAKLARRPAGEEKENTSRTRRIERPPPPPRKFPLATVLMVTVIAAAAGSAGYLLSQREQTVVIDHPVAESVPPPAPKQQPVAAPSANEGVAPTPVPDDIVFEPVEQKRSKKRRGASTATVSPAKAPAPAPAPAPSAAPVAPAVTTASPPAPVAHGAFDRSAAMRVMDQAARGAEGSCSKPGEPNGTGIVWLSFVATGKAVGVSLKGPLSGTTTGLCVLRSFYKVTVPAFEGEPVSMNREVHIH